MRTLARVLALLAASATVPGAAQEDRLVWRMNRFAATYREFAAQHNRGVFDAALARKLSEEWREVETSGEWPRGDSR